MNRLIAILTKQYSPIILVSTNDPDMWFIDIKEVYQDSGKVINETCIIQKDLTDYLNYKECKGYSIMQRTKFN